LYHTLFQPVPGVPTPVELPAPTPPPGEEYFRQQLGVALGIAEQANAALAEAEAASARAGEHRQMCLRRTEAFADLDSEISDATVAALRTGGDPGLRDELAARIIERERARMELAAAATALETLAQERAAAAQRAEAATRAADLLALRVVGFVAQRVGDECQELQAEIARRRTALLGFDRLIAGRSVPMPASVGAVLGSSMTMADVNRADPGPWRAAVDALKADPQAAIEIALPDATVPMPRTRPQEAIPPAPPDDGDPALVPVTDHPEPHQNHVAGA
jgi:hypothetical protein